MKEIDELVVTLEVVRDAVVEKNSDEGFEAITVFLTQYIAVFGHSREMVAKTLPVLEQIKNCIQAGAYDEAYPIILALLAKLRQASKLAGD